ncbi:MAG: hypothetical protein HKL84_10270 [Acidimicrobiaceae bacterium]|nr:hypothetical protein [Acidimicrobiaceae bacterium]
MATTSKNTSLNLSILVEMLYELVVVHHLANPKGTAHRAGGTAGCGASNLFQLGLHGSSTLDALPACVLTAVGGVLHVT